MDEDARLVDATGAPVHKLTGNYAGATPPDAAAAEEASKWPRCSQMRQDNLASFPNFIRIINARHISPPTNKTVGGTTVVTDV